MTKKVNKYLGDYRGYLYILPWVIGFLFLGLLPFIMSIVISFTDWPLIGQAHFVGLKNFETLFTSKAFYKVLWDTSTYAVLSISIGMVASLAIAMLLNTKIRFLSIYRTIFYLPAVVSGVAVGMMWQWVLDPNYGLLNQILAIFGIQGPNWLGNPNWVVPTYVMIAVWGAGGAMLTYLVGLKDIPSDLYEAAEIDGAGFWVRLFKITLPMMSPILFYNLVMNIIGSMRQFNLNYILGGTNFIMVDVYDNAFKYNKMGYACAEAWILVVIILILTLIVFKSSSMWVFIDSSDENKKETSKRNKKNKKIHRNGVNS